MPDNAGTPDEQVMTGVPMRGYVIRDQLEYLWVRDKLSTWMIETRDVLYREEWSGVDDDRFSGTPQIVHIRDGAEIQEVRPVQLVARERPLALGDINRELQVLGASIIDELARTKMFDLTIMGRSAEEVQAADAGTDAGAPRPTYCMKDDTGWGIVSHKDD